MSDSSPTPPVALTIAGSDTSAGAGMQADLKTFQANGVYGVNAITAIVAEVPGEVSSVSPVNPTLLESQLNRVSASFSLSAVKTGMLATAAIVHRVADFCTQIPETPLVIDPVIRASAGAELLTAEGVSTLKRSLLPLASLVTPNLPEAEQLLGRRLPPDEAAVAFYEHFGCNVLVKGGHAGGPAGEIIDFAMIGGDLHPFAHPRLPVPDLHGTGCTLSAAIAARLAWGDSPAAAIATATSYLAATMSAHFHWPEPAACRALNHLPNEVESGKP